MDKRVSHAEFDVVGFFRILAGGSPGICRAAPGAAAALQGGLEERGDFDS